MRRKFITALSLLIVFTVVFSLQVVSTASAESKNGHPLTSPLTFFQINGNVTYKIFQFFAHGKERFTPAAGVTVSSENIFNHHKYQTTTDSNGNYTLSVEEKGIYLVTPSGGQTNAYVPPVQVVNANNKHGVKNHVDFQGFLHP